VRHVTRPLPLSDSGPEFHPRQADDTQSVAARGAREPDHLVGAWLAHVELHQGAGVQVIEGQSLSSLAQHSLREKLTRNRHWGEWGPEARFVVQDLAQLGERPVELDGRDRKLRILRVRNFAGQNPLPINRLHQYPLPVLGCGGPSMSLLRQVSISEPLERDEAELRVALSLGQSQHQILHGILRDYRLCKCASLHRLWMPRLHDGRFFGRGGVVGYGYQASVRRPTVCGGIVLNLPVFSDMAMPAGYLRTC